MEAELVPSLFGCWGASLASHEGCFSFSPTRCLLISAPLAEPHLPESWNPTGWTEGSTSSTRAASNIPIPSGFLKWNFIIPWTWRERCLNVPEFISELNSVQPRWKRLRFNHRCSTRAKLFTTLELWIIFQLHWPTCLTLHCSTPY